MKTSPGITSVESKASFRQKLVEKFVQQNLPPKECKQNKICGMGAFAERFKEIEYCAAETPVIGNVEIFSITKFFNAIHNISIPVKSRFLVFCTRNDYEEYKVAWSCSLS